VTSFLFTMLREKKDGFRVDLQEGDHGFQDLIDAHSPADRPAVTVTPDDKALFQYSGGTTGVPKAAIALHRNLVANTLQIISWITNLDPGNEVVLLAIPLFHAYGMITGLGFGIATAGKLILVPNPRDLDDLLKNLVRHKATMFPGVPTLFNAINVHPDVKAGKYDLKSIKICISGSAALLRETKDRFEALTGGYLFEGYGLSEAPTATHCNPVLGRNKEGSIGLPLPDVEVRVIDLDDGMTVLPQGEVGEMVIRGPQVMFGYHNMPTETMNTLRDGWLYTGDIVTMDADGYFYIVDRKKELIKPGGFQVWPREVEEVLQAHPKILEVGVAGVPDPYRGETVKAWCVLHEGESATVDEIRAYCKDKMATYKVPTEVEFIEEIPKSNVGKILRRELVRMHSEKK
jgi:long-chain acyl-CoA synthetase